MVTVLLVFLRNVCVCIAVLTFDFYSCLKFLRHPVLMVIMFFFLLVFLGGFHYLHVGKPTLGIRLDSLMAQSDYVSDLRNHTSNSNK